MRQAEYQRCRGKECYPSRADAKTAAQQIALGTQDRRLEPYQCGLCGRFHLAQHGDQE
jgi:hypothetical protein